jgi:hypothetical protein
MEDELKEREIQVEKKERHVREMEVGVFHMLQDNFKKETKKGFFAFLDLVD